MSGEEAPNLKLRVSVEDGPALAELELLPTRTKAVEDKINSQSKKAADERVGHQKAAYDADQRYFLAGNAKKSESLITHHKEILNLQLKRDLAVADQQVVQHAKQKARQEAYYRYEKALHQGNAEALELIDQKHAAKIEAIALNQAVASERPFAQLLTRMGVIVQEITGLKVKALHDVGEAAGYHGLMAKGSHPADTMTMLASGAGGKSIANLGAEATIAAGGVSKLAGGMGSMLAAGAGIGVAIMGWSKLTSTVHEASEAYEGQLKADLKLQAAMNATGNTRNGSVRQLSEYASAMQKVTKFSDDQIESAEAVGLQFNHLSGDSFPRAVKAAMDLAAFTGGDLTDAMRTVGLATSGAEGTARKLREANIVLTEGQKHQIETMQKAGKTSELTAFMLGLLESKVKGVAESTALESEKLANRWDDAMEKVGKATHGWGVFFKSVSVAVVEGLVAEDTEVQKLEKSYKRLELTAYGSLSADVKKKYDEEIAYIRRKEQALKDAAKVAQDDPRTHKGDDAGALELVRKQNEADEKLRKDAEKKAKADAEENAKARNATKIAQYEAGLDTQRAASEAEFKEAKRATAEQEKEYDAEDALRMARAETELQKMDVQHDIELSKFTGTQREKTLVLKRQELERSSLVKKSHAEEVAGEKKLAHDHLAISVNLYNALGNLAIEALGKSKANRAAVKAIQISEAVANTAVAVTGFLSAEPIGPWNWAQAAAAGAMGATQIMQIQKAEKGMWVGGRRHSEGGTIIEAERGERIISRNDVDRMGGPDAVDSMIGGGGGFNYHASPSQVTVHVTGGGDPAVIGAAVASHVNQISIAEYERFETMARRLGYVRQNPGYVRAR